MLLNTIYADDGNGEVSKDYPRTLKDIFDLDGTSYQRHWLEKRH